MKLFTILISLIAYLNYSKGLSYRLKQADDVKGNVLSKESKNNNNEESENNRKNSQYVIMNAEVSTLVEVPVSYTTGISYYYPYFYKTHLISFAEDSNSFFNQYGGSNSTCNQNCEVCDVSNNTTKCSKCTTGYFLNEGRCVDYCPDGKTADILRAKCINTSLEQNMDLLYSKAYSLGSCSNMCGKIVQDCSCSPSCKSRGNCCTDYDVVNCDLVIEKASKIDPKNCSSGCELCENIAAKNSTSNSNDTNHSNYNYKCNQCNETSLLLNGNCLEKCPQGYHPDNINRICFKNENKCDLDCEKCHPFANNKTECLKCRKGKFLYNSKCLEKCPDGFRADRITWTCLEPPVFGWYWVYPSKYSCKNQCNAVNKEFDCSCSKECMLEGTCCPDYDFQCGEIIFMRKSGSSKYKKKNSKK